jgi:hypothetical protein
VTPRRLRVAAALVISIPRQTAQTVPMAAYMALGISHPLAEGGSGGFAMMGLEWLTAIRERLSLFGIVFVDGHLGRIRHQQSRSTALPKPSRSPIRILRCSPMRWAWTMQGREWMPKSWSGMDSTAWESSPSRFRWAIRPP